MENSLFSSCFQFFVSFNPGRSISGDCARLLDQLVTDVFAGSGLVHKLRNDSRVGKIRCRIGDFENVDDSPNITVTY